MTDNMTTLERLQLCSILAIAGYLAFMPTTYKHIESTNKPDAWLVVHKGSKESDSLVRCIVKAKSEEEAVILANQAIEGTDRNIRYLASMDYMCCGVWAESACNAGKTNLIRYHINSCKPV